MRASARGFDIIRSDSPERRTLRLSGRRQPARSSLLLGGPVDLDRDGGQPRSLLGARQMGLDRECQRACREIGPQRVSHLAEQCGAGFIRDFGHVTRQW